MKKSKTLIQFGYMGGARGLFLGDLLNTLRERGMNELADELTERGNQAFDLLDKGKTIPYSHEQFGHNFGCPKDCKLSTNVWTSSYTAPTKIWDEYKTERFTSQLLVSLNWIKVLLFGVLLLSFISLFI